MRSKKNMIKRLVSLLLFALLRQLQQIIGSILNGQQP